MDWISFFIGCMIGILITSFINLILNLKEIKKLQANMIFKDCKTVSECEEKLNALIEPWPYVYCSKPDKNNSHLWSHNKTEGYDTHKARLAFIEEIVEPCWHEPTVRYQLGISETMKPVCKRCGVELVADWRAK